MREKEIEKKLTLEAKKRGGLAVKFVSPGFDGMPDRILLMPEGKMAFVEVKSPGKRPRVYGKIEIQTSATKIYRVNLLV